MFYGSVYRVLNRSVPGETLAVVEGRRVAEHKWAQIVEVINIEALHDVLQKAHMKVKKKNTLNCTHAQKRCNAKTTSRC